MDINIKLFRLTEDIIWSSFSHVLPNLHFIISLSLPGLSTSISIPPWSTFLQPHNPSLIDLPPTLQSSLLNFLQPCNHPSKLSSNLAIIPPNCPFHRAAPSKSLQSAPFLTPSFEHAPSPLYPWDKDIIRFQIYGVSVCVLNSHLAAHDHNNQVYLLSIRIMVDIFRTTNLSSYLIYPQRMRS